MAAAVIDIGSSSIKLIIGEREDDQIKILESLKNPMPLGRYAFLKGRLSQDLINQTISLLENYKNTLKEYDIKDVKVIATTAVREADNKDIFLDTVRRKTGFDIEVLNAGDVVYYIDSFLSLKLKKKYPIYEKNLLIVELGAGTLDISVMEKGYAIMNLGIPTGSLRIKQFKSKIDGSLKEAHEAISEYIESEIFYLKKIIPKLQIDDVILIDETHSTFLNKILPDESFNANFFQFKEEDAKKLLLILSESNPDNIAATYKIPADIADTMDGYAIILHALYQLIKKNHIYILETSLPEALLANQLFDFELSKQSNKLTQLVSVAKFLCRKYNLDLNHAQQVAKLSQRLFDEFKETFGLNDNDAIYLILAAYLHDIGMFISNRSHHKHSEYIISSLNLFRLTEEEIKIIACVARYHRKAPPMRSHLLYSSLSLDKQIIVQKLSALLRIANALDRSHKQKIEKLEVRLNKKQDISLIAYAKDNIVSEKLSFLEKKELFEEISGNQLSLVVKYST